MGREALLSCQVAMQVLGVPAQTLFRCLCCLLQAGREFYVPPLQEEL